jgi:phosphatidylglycerol lysyltransferase
MWSAIFDGRASLRAQRNRATNKGVIVEEWPAERASGSPELEARLAEWLDTRGLPPLHFLVEPDTLDRLFDRRVFVASRAREPVGFLIASPVPVRAGWLIEQFVRGDAAPNGTVDLLLDVSVRALAASGARYVTLGLAPLSTRATTPPIGDGESQDDVLAGPNPLWLELSLRWVRAHGRRFYNFDGLDAFKAKFQPDRWEPVYAIVNAPEFRPRHLYAIAAAFSEGSPMVLVARAMGRALAVETRRISRWFARRARDMVAGDRD